ncbi:MAG: hypothetical protein ACPLYC_01730, partial [Minisyncoccia bacterium]
TKFDKVFPNVYIKLTNPWGYITLIEHINTFKYFLSQEEKREVPIEEAVKLWYENIFSKVVELIKKKKLVKYFPNRTSEDLYIWIMDHWHYLKENTKNPLIPIERAIEDFESFQKNLYLSKSKRFLINLILTPLKLLYKLLKEVLKKII